MTNAENIYNWLTYNGSETQMTLLYSCIYYTVGNLHVGKTLVEGGTICEKHKVHLSNAG